MIQRKQSIWLLIAALLNAGVLYFDLYRTHTTINGADVPGQLRTGDRYLSLLVALVMILLPLVTIFMFRNRKRQVAMTVVSMLACFSFIGMLLSRVGNMAAAAPPASGTYWIGAVLPVIAIIFLIMAALGIRKDDKLVKSVDRLR